MRRRQLLYRAIASGLATLGIGEPTGSISAQPRTSTLGDAGIISTVLGSVSPAAVPGYYLQLVRSERPIAWSSGMRDYSGAVIFCVTSGELAVKLQAGTAIVWRAQEADAPSAEVLPLAVPVICQKNDCFTADADTIPTMYTAWNAGREPVVLWEVHLFPVPLSRHWQCG